MRSGWKWTALAFASGLLAASAAAAFKPLSLDTVHSSIGKGKNGAGQGTTSLRGRLTIDRKDYGIGEGSIATKISLQDEIAIDLLVVVLQ